MKLTVMQSKSKKRFVVVASCYDAGIDGIISYPITGYYKTEDKAIKRMKEIEIHGIK